MKIKLDENISASLCGIFTANGYNADTVYSEGLAGCSDEILFSRIKDEGRLLITCDVDFADIRLFPPSTSGGIIVLRLSNRSSRAVATRIEQLLKSVPLSELSGATTIVSDNRIRMRR